MGASLGSSGGAGRASGRGGRRRHTAMAEINMTPFIDVVLVLLIIFMVSAPMLSTGVPVDLPKAGAPALKDKAEPIEVRVLKNRIMIGEKDVALPQLTAQLKALSKENPDTPIYLRADRTLPYEQVMQIITTVRQGGFTKLALLSDSSK